MDPLVASKVDSDKRKIEYKRLLEIGAQAVQNNENTSAIDSIELCYNLIEKSNDLLNSGSIDDRIGKSSELVLDAQVVKIAHDLLGSTVNRIESDVFDEDGFVNGLLKFITTDDGVRDFKRLDPIVCTKVKRFRFSPSLVGHIDFSTPCNSELLTAPKQSKKRGKTIVGEIQRPAAIQQPGLDGNDKTKVNQVLAIIAKVYRENGQQAIPYYKLIIDPTSVMYTFNNSFQLSFLFRDGFVAFETGPDGFPAVRPTATRKGEDGNEDDRISFVVPLNDAIIQEHMERYNIHEPMLNIEREDAEQ